MFAPEDATSPLAAVIGGGPAGLMAAEVLARGGVCVELYEAMPWPGRKLLVAGKGGLNLTRDEPRQQFLQRYGARRPQIEPHLAAFGPDELRAWLHALGFETFMGTSGKVFPRGMKSGPILHAWLERLKATGVVVHTRHRWLGWSEEGLLQFETPQGRKLVRAATTVLALGGGSRARLGSDGAWVPLLRARGIPVAALRPANCGFDIAWSEHFRARFAGQPVKAVVLSFTSSQGQSFHQRGEFVVTENGVEGSLIYAASALLRDEIETQGKAVIQLDLAPDWPLPRLSAQLARPRGSRSISEHLRRTVRLQGVKAGLLWEFLPRERCTDSLQWAAAIKSLPIPLLSPRPLDEAISSAGGVAFAALDEHLMIRSLPGVFCAGEMLDWEAPTGGYLLTACFSTGRAAGLGALAWIEANRAR